MRLRFLVFAIVILFSSFTNEHPLKMTFSKLNIGPEGSVNLETRFFLDDLITHLEKLYCLEEVDFSNNSTEGTQALERYFKDHFYFEQDGKKLPLLIKNVSYAKTGLALEVSMSTSHKLDRSKEVFLFNTLLCDAFPMQANGIKYMGIHYLLNIGEPKVKIQFE